jgi:hypothetical protein
MAECLREHSGNHRAILTCEMAERFQKIARSCFRQQGLDSLARGLMSARSAAWSIPVRRVCVAGCSAPEHATNGQRANSAIAAPTVILLIIIALPIHVVAMGGLSRKKSTCPS